MPLSYSIKYNALILGIPIDWLGFPGSSAGKESACNAGDHDLIPGSGRSPAEVIGYPLQYSWASMVAQMVRNPLKCGRPQFDPWVGKIPWRVLSKVLYIFTLGCNAHHSTMTWELLVSIFYRWQNWDTENLSKLSYD